jgi:DNA-binding FadR family transcriptional regulator
MPASTRAPPRTGAAVVGAVMMGAAVGGAVMMGAAVGGAVMMGVVLAGRVAAGVAPAGRVTGATDGSAKPVGGGVIRPSLQSWDDSGRAMLPMTLTPAAPRSGGRQTLVRQVIDQLRANIASGEWPLNSKIPTEPQLVAALGVGRNTIREAVRALVHAGVLECRQGSGTYVISTDELSGMVTRRLATAETADTVEVRRAFEVEGARLAALRRTPEDLAALDRALADREAAWRSGRVADFVEADVMLHNVILAAAHNAMLAELYASVGAAMRATVAQSVGGELSPDRYVDHSKLVDAIRAGDPARAAHEAGAFLEAVSWE